MPWLLHIKICTHTRALRNSRACCLTSHLLVTQSNILIDYCRAILIQGVSKVPVHLYKHIYLSQWTYSSDSRMVTWCTLVMGTTKGMCVHRLLNHFPHPMLAVLTMLRGSVLTVQSSEHEAIMLSLKGFHFTSRTGPLCPVTRLVLKSNLPVCNMRKLLMNINNCKKYIFT
jgi:hypothetical protein